MLASPDKGSRNGEVYFVNSWRSLDGDTFAELVRDAWVGSQGDATENLLRILGLPPLVLAVEEPVRM